MKLKLSVNGVEHQLDVHPMRRLLDVLREDLRLTGSKEGCGEGECGACTVLLDGAAVMSCLVPVCQCDGREIETIEGVADGAVLHPVQQAFLECGGAQCGICTPGMIVAAVAYMRDPKTAPGGIAEALEGNLCRCTGYKRIVQSVEQAMLEGAR